MENNQEKPAWMLDELVKDIPEQKLDFLNEMFVKGQGKSQKELMFTMMPLLKKARQQNLALTSEEMKAAIAAIKKHSLPEEIEKIDNILNRVAK